MKILTLPLDQRPYNYDFLYSVTKGVKNLELILPQKKDLGFRKESADFLALDQFLENHTNVDAYIISAEMLLYGGLFTSRIHDFNEEQLTARLQIFSQLKQKNPHSKIYVSNLIMRNPSYSSSEEEPWYYAESGADIFRWGFLYDKIQQNKHKQSEKEEWQILDSKINKEHLNDYRERRALNLKITNKIIELAKNQIIDILFIPRDDTAEFGLGRMDRDSLEQSIKHSNIYSHPGTDEAMCTLLTRAYADITNIQFKCSCIFSGDNNFIPKYEDTPLPVSLKSQLTLTGIQQSDEDPDLILAIHTPYEQMDEARNQLSIPEHSNALKTFTDRLRKEKAPTVIADIAYANGGDGDLVRYLDQEKILDRIISYAAWNTTGNTIGTCLFAGFFALISDNPQALHQFLVERLLSDWVYQANIRWDLEKNFLPTINASYASFNNRDKDILNKIKEKVLILWKEQIKNSFHDIDINTLQIEAPFKRMSGLSFKL